MEHIRQTLPDGEEIVLLDETETSALDHGPDPRRTSLVLRREALADQPSPRPPSTTTPTGH